jgi:hypothetical protein
MRATRRTKNTANEINTCVRRGLIYGYWTSGRGWARRRVDRRMMTTTKMETMMVVIPCRAAPERKISPEV